MITSKTEWHYCLKVPSLWKKSLHFYLRQNTSLSRTHMIPLYWDSSQNIIIFHHDKIILNNEKLSFMLSIRFRLSLDCFKKRQKQKYIKKSPLKKREISLLIIYQWKRNILVKKVVKAKNLIAFRIWLEKLGYSVKTLADNRGFTFSFKKEYGLVTCDLAGNNLAMQLGEEFEDHLKA